MTRDEFKAKLKTNGFEPIGDDMWKMKEQPPKPWARIGARLRDGQKYDSLVFFQDGGVGVSERSPRSDQSTKLFSRPWESDAE